MKAQCVGILMDGNRRWARGHGLSISQGHATGLKKAKEITRHAFARGVDTVILYAFSTENWNRPPEEVKHLMKLFGGALVRELDELSREGIRVRFIGDLTRLPESLRAAAERFERERSHSDSGKTLAIALSYGGRAEILAAVNRLLKEGKESMNEEDMRAVLWSTSMRDPDLIIRTGGEKRLSNFLPWQSVYSELFFLDTLWPDFSKEELDAVLADFSERERRHGR
ncbi:di-trans,poly-cis-decaprenylcistransferase [Patescibacteria group bacterium]|nr:di-trans,poly-cis-decaprenylcistransferase [Patescibacteria group bacterium]